MGGAPVRDDELFVERRDGTRFRAVEQICQRCGGRFLAVKSQVAMDRAHFCSYTCARTRPVADRFWQKVSPGDTAACWEWQGNRHPSGYGILWRGRKSMKAHRVSWMLHNGPIPDGLAVLHHCDNPPCVNPAHLYVGTWADNARDRVIRKRGKEQRQVGEQNDNAKLTEADVRAIIVALQDGQTQTAVAKHFGIKQPHVSRIVRRESWRHLWAK